MSDRPNNLNLGKDFLLLWGNTPTKVGNTVLVETVTSVPGGGGGSTVPPIDLLTWVIMNLADRSSKHMTGTNTNSYHVLDTDPAYPVGFPPGVFIWIKNVLGNPWDIEKYDLNTLYHWITEDGDPVDQPACVAAGFPGGCWGDPSAYKRFLTPVPFMPRFFVPGAVVVLNNPSPNKFVRTTNCEVSSAIINLGDVQTVTSGPFNMSWGGTVDAGAGGGIIDNVNGVPTIQNDYYYGGNIAGATFIDKESTYYVQGSGRVAWQYYRKINGVWQLQQQTINNNKVSGATTAVFPCGAGKPWWV